jgi:hypothetical protein
MNAGNLAFDKFKSKFTQTCKQQIKLSGGCHTTPTAPQASMGKL